MAIYDFFLSRNGAPVTRANYVGNKGRLFYDDATGEIRLSDGVVPGGLSIPITLATSTVAGGIKLGPGVGLNIDGQLIIDSVGLDFSFGDFNSTVQTLDGVVSAVLSSNNSNKPIVVASPGSIQGAIKMVSDLRVYKFDTDLNTSLSAVPVVSIGDNGKIKMLVPTAASDPTSAFEIIGNDSGSSYSPGQLGVVIHTTGADDTIARAYFDANNNYSALVGRRYNGSVGALTKVLEDEVVFVIAGQASTGPDFELFSSTNISFLTTEDQGPNNQGGRVEINVTTNGSSYTNGRVVAADFRAEGVVVQNLLASTVNSSIGTASEPFDDIFGSLTGQVSDISNHATTDLVEGTNLYFTDTRATTAVGGAKNDAGTGTSDLWSADKIVSYTERYSAYNEAEGQQTTAQSTFVQALTLAATIPETGDYEVTWSMEARNTAKDRDTVVRVQMDNSTTLMEVSHGRENDKIVAFRQLGGFRRYNITAGVHNFDVDFLAGEATAQIRRIRIQIKKVI